MSTSKPKIRNSTSSSPVGKSQDVGFMDHLTNTRPNKERPATAQERMEQATEQATPRPKGSISTTTYNALSELETARNNVGSALEAADELVNSAEDALHKQVDSYIEQRSEITEGYLNPVAITARVFNSAVAKAAEGVSSLSDREFSLEDLFAGMLPGKDELELPMLEESKGIRFQLPPTFRSHSSEATDHSPYTSYSQPALSGVATTSTSLEPEIEENYWNTESEQSTQKPSTSSPISSSETTDITSGN